MLPLFKLPSLTDIDLETTLQNRSEIFETQCNRLGVRINHNSFLSWLFGNDFSHFDNPQWRIFQHSSELFTGVFEPLLELGNVIAIFSMHNSENLQEILFDRVETKWIFIINQRKFLWILHEVINNLLTV